MVKSKNKDRKIEMLQQMNVKMTAQKRQAELDIELLRNELKEAKKKQLSQAESEELERSIEIASQLSSSSETSNSKEPEPSAKDEMETKTTPISEESASKNK